MWKCPTEGTYIVIEHEMSVDVCPSEDIRAHTLEKGDCICHPDVHWDEGKLFIVHARMDEQDAVESAVSKLFS